MNQSIDGLWYIIRSIGSYAISSFDQFLKFHNQSLSFSIDFTFGSRKILFSILLTLARCIVMCFYNFPLNNFSVFLQEIFQSHNATWFEAFLRSAFLESSLLIQNPFCQFPSASSQQPYE